MVAIGSALTYEAALRFFWECATPPNIHLTSKYVIVHSEFYLAFPCVGTVSE